MERIKEILATRDRELIRNYLREHGLRIEKTPTGHVIVPEQERAEYVGEQIVFWNSRQQARKILLNSLYGALLNEALRFSDERMGQSTTLSGRSIVKHMNAEANRTLVGKYDYVGEVVLASDTDSLVSNETIFYDGGTISIGDFFELCSKTKTWEHDSPFGVKEYSWADFKVGSYDPITDQFVMKPLEYVYRHKVSKEKWRITDQFGNQVTVTGDHSVMIERDGIFMEVKPRDMLMSDIIITVKD